MHLNIMAMSVVDIADVRDQLKDMTICCICYDTFKEPKLLPCIHTFCTGCVSRLGATLKKSPGDKMPCPVCRREFVIPVEGFAGLPKNFFMERLLEMTKILTPARIRDACDICQEENNPDESPVPTSELYCVECRLKLCRGCCEHHKRSKLTAKHHLVTDENQANVEDLTLNVGPSYCQKHGNEELKMYCVDCKVVLCALCYIELHQSHQWSRVDSAAEDLRKEMQRNVDGLAIRNSEIARKKDRFEHRRTEVLANAERLESEVIKAREELRLLVDRHAEKLLTKIQQRRHQALKEIENEKNDMDLQSASLESYKNYCAFIATKGTSAEICRSATDLNTRAAELNHQCDAALKREISPQQFAFRSRKLKELLKDENIIGKMEPQISI